MKKVYRQLLLFASSIVFLALAPLIILYAIGYRTTFPTIDPVPIGVALVETIPSRADIAVNGRYVGRTPRAVNNLVVGSFRLDVTKEGYTSWAKTLHVRPGRATDVRDVRLFPATIAPQTLFTNATTFALAPNRQIAAVVDTNQRLSFLDDRGTVLRAPQQLPWQPLSMLWSPNSTEVLLRGSNGAYGLVSVDQRYAFSLLNLPLTTTTAVWHPRAPQHVLATMKNGNLVDVELTTSAQQVLETNIKMFATSARDLYAITQENRVIRINFQGRAQSLPFTTPDTELINLAVTPAGHVALVGAQGTTYVYTEDTGLVEIGIGVQALGWSPDGHMLYLAPDQYSLHVYNATDESAVLAPGQAHLVVRLSRPLSHIQWFAGSRHLIYQIEDEITITEIDTRDHPISYTADTTNTGNAMTAVGLEGESLFYLKKTDNAQHLYHTPLLSE